MLGWLLAAALIGSLLDCSFSAAAAPGWLAPVDVSQPGRSASNPVVAMGEAGDTTMLWERRNTANSGVNVQLATREPGSGFGEPADLALGSTGPVVATTPAGGAIAAWRRFANPPGSYVIEAATRPPGGAFSAPQEVGEFEQGALPVELDVAMNASGDAVLAWQRFDPQSGLNHVACETSVSGPVLCPNPPFVEASVLTPGGGFSAPVRVSAPRGTEKPLETPKEIEEREIEESQRAAFEPSVAIDAAGDAIVAWTYFDGANHVTQTSTRPAGGAFSAPEPLSAPGDEAFEPDVAMDSAGDVDAVWSRSNGTHPVIQAAHRQAGAGFSPPVDLSDSSVSGGSPSIAVTPGGAATAVWVVGEEGISAIQASEHEAGAPFTSTTTISKETREALFPVLAVNPSGRALAAWSSTSSTGPSVVEAVTRAGLSDAFTPPTPISEASEEILHPQVAIDGAGDGTAVWSRSDGTNGIVQAAGFDAYVPVLRDLAIPSTGTVGVPVSFAVSPFDVWPLPGPASFSFGDGAVASANSPTHTYTKAGVYPVSVKITDGGGATATATGSIAIAPANGFTLGKLKLNRKKGTGTLAVTVPGPGRLALSGKGLKTAGMQVKAAGTVKLPVKAVGKALKRLASKGRLKVTAKISFTPEGGTASVLSKSITLLRRHS